MLVANYKHFGGKHWETAAIKNTLAHAGVLAPHTGEPFSEALCLGIAGGIGAGYSFCPSYVGQGFGGGITIVGRTLSYATDAEFYEGFFDRIGARTQITESTGPKAAYKNLRDALAAGNPVIVWCARFMLPYYGSDLHSCSMYSLVVHGVDEGAGVAYLADRAATSLTIALDDLEKARAQICAHNNRTLTFDAPAKLTSAGLKDAVLEGIRACTQSLLKPKIKTFSLEGVQEWSKLITNGKNTKGWPKVYTGGKLYLALRDVYHSIETAGTGGSLYRNLYAEFLDEAGTITKQKGFSDAARHYRELGKAWSDLAETALPSKVKPFKETKELLARRCRLFEEQGAEALDEIRSAGERLKALESEIVAGFPLKSQETADLLEQLRGRIVALHESETKAIAALERLVK
ncbi:MAG TPA: DUF4872 domain-containing protein [Phycisphaerae bacterium]